jgi:hypothetical protein
VLSGACSGNDRDDEPGLPQLFNQPQILHVCQLSTTFRARWQGISQQQAKLGNPRGPESLWLTSHALAAWPNDMVLDTSADLIPQAPALRLDEVSSGTSSCAMHSRAVGFGRGHSCFRRRPRRHRLASPAAAALLPAQAALYRYLASTVKDFPKHVGQLEVFQFSHGQSNPTYLVKVCHLHALLSPGSRPPGSSPAGSPLPSTTFPHSPRHMTP